ncbi:hypothetical protein [Mucilaginibacter segetis]|uniref:Uncharacterized protein n=1 Tax=Mucilaginibacter segetis TaxID=2793071 RepID=A0A934PUS9_9SPHI|nr:hypothetical protein [Mucilaginibacter segetis]MBK0379951.1 hypothetical protein [Mucilaginibacter segetis]
MSIRFFIYLLLLLAVFTYGMLNFKRLSIPFKILTFFLGLTFLSETISRIAILLYRNSAPVDHIFAVTEYIMVAMIYYRLSTDKTFKRFLLFSIPVFIILAIFSMLLYQGILEFPSVLLSIQEVAFVIFSLLYFKEMLLNPISISLKKQSAFWFNTAFFLFSSVIFLCFGLMNSFIKSKLGTTFLDTFVYTLNIIFYCTIGLSLIIESKKTINVSYH